MSSHQLPGLYRLTSILSIYLDFLRWKFNMFFLYISSQPLSVLYRPNSNYQYTLTFFRWKLNVFFCIFIFRGYQLLSGPLHGSSNNMNNGLGAHGTNGSMWNQLFLNLRRQTERCVNSRPGMSINLLTTRWKPKKKKACDSLPKIWAVWNGRLFAVKAHCAQRNVPLSWCACGAVSHLLVVFQLHMVSPNMCKRM